MLILIIIIHTINLKAEVLVSVCGGMHDNCYRGNYVYSNNGDII